MKKIRYKSLLFLIIVSSFSLVDLFHHGLPLTHDGFDHVVRIANFYLSLHEGIIVPRWAANLNFGYGHPILTFLYPLPSYIASLFHALGFSFENSVKFVFGIGFLGSGFSMYLFLREITDDFESTIGSLLYMLTPYRFIDLYVRGDIGENLAFLFIPLVFYFLIKLYRKQSVGIMFCGGVSFALLILSHNAISLMVLPLIIFYAIYLYWKKQNKKYVIYTFGMLTFGFLLSAFFWVPGLIEGKYTLRNIVTKGGYKKNFVEPLRLLYGEWSFGGSGQFSVQLGIANWLGILFSPLVIYKIYKMHNKRYLFLFVFLLATLIALFLMLKQSDVIWSKFILLQNFQFPWRFLAVTVFTTAVIVPLSIALLPGKIRIWSGIIIIVLTIFFNRNYWHAKSFVDISNKSVSRIYHGTTDTGESAPIWSIRFMEHAPSAHLEIIEGKGTIQETHRTTTNHKYVVNLALPSRLRENTLYFPGWHVYVDGKETSVEFQDQRNRGLMTFYATSGYHTIDVKFEETKLRKICDLVSILSLASMLFYAILHLLLWRRFR